MLSNARLRCISMAQEEIHNLRRDDTWITFLNPVFFFSARQAVSGQTAGVFLCGLEGFFMANSQAKAASLWMCLLGEG